MDISKEMKDRNRENKIISKEIKYENSNDGNISKEMKKNQKIETIFKEIKIDDSKKIVLKLRIFQKHIKENT